MLETACGSPCYAAPEMIAGKAYNGLMIDIWSSGIVLYAMTCGFLPFDDKDTQVLYKKIIQGQFQIPNHISQSLSSLLNQILQINPNKRIRINEIKNHAWFNTNKIFVSPGLVVGLDQMPIQDQIVKKTANYGYNEQQLKQFLQHNKHNQWSTAYYLTLLKHRKELKIKNDPTSMNFVPVT